MMIEFDEIDDCDEQSAEQELHANLDAINNLRKNSLYVDELLYQEVVENSEK